MKIQCIVFRIALALTAMMSAALAQDRSEVAKEILGSVAVVELPDWRATGGSRFGAAFCIEKTGRFVTSARVAQAARNGVIPLILNAAQPNAQTIRAKVVRSDPAVNLAILQAEDPRELASLTLAAGAALYETQRVYAMGPSVGRRWGSPEDAQECFGIVPQKARIAHLLTRKGRLELVELEPEMSPALVGGPLLAGNATVLGILLADETTGRVSTAIPVERLRQFLAEAPSLPAERPVSPATLPSATRPAATWEGLDAPVALEDERVTRTLPAAIMDVIPAAGGRALLMPMHEMRKIALFDVSKARVTHYFSLDCDDYVAAAGLEKLLVVDRTKNVVQRWDLLTHQKELTRALPPLDNATVFAPAMGYASNGPLMLSLRRRSSWGAPPLLLDIATLRPIPYNGQALGANWQATPGSAFQIRTSADGTTATGWLLGDRSCGLRRLVVRGGSVTGSFAHGGEGLPLPLADGSQILTADGIFDSRSQRLDNNRMRGKQCIPTVDPAFFLTVEFIESPFNGRGRPEGIKEAPEVCIYTADRQKLFAIEGLDELEDAKVRKAVQHPLLLDKRIHLFPGAELLITVGGPRDQLILRRLRIKDLLDKTGNDYLLVASSPPAALARGDRMAYRPRVLSKFPGVRIALESGPDGMKVDASGCVEWQVPAQLPPGPVSVILSLKSPSGREAFHVFTITAR